MQKNNVVKFLKTGLVALVVMANASSVSASEYIGDKSFDVLGRVAAINSLDVDVPLNLSFIIDESRNISYTEEAKIVSHTAAPLQVSIKEVTASENAPALALDDKFDDWDSLTIEETKNNIAISINNVNLLDTTSLLGELSSGFRNPSELPLDLSVLYGKVWVNTSDLNFSYNVGLSFKIKE